MSAQTNFVNKFVNRYTKASSTAKTIALVSIGQTAFNSPVTMANTLFNGFALTRTPQTVQDIANATGQSVTDVRRALAAGLMTNVVRVVGHYAGNVGRPAVAYELV